MSIVRFERAADVDQCMDLVGNALFIHSAAGEEDVRALRAAAGTSGCVVLVSKIDGESREWSELPFRIMHATVALLAQMGVISGRCLVAVDKQGYGAYEHRRPDTLEQHLPLSRYKYKLRVIGAAPSFLVARADELVDQLESFDAYRHARAVEIGARRHYTKRLKLV
jgi:hypothetical protein